MRIDKTLPLLAFAAVVLAACSDNGAAPAAPETSLRPQGPRLTLATTSTTTAVLYPTYDNVYVSAEGHRIFIPAYSVCQPGVSGYGPSTWNLPCQPATTPIVFTITTSVDANGRPRVTILPDVRFNPNKTVTVDFADAVAAAKYNALIQYCPTVGGPCVDESLSDPSLATRTNPSTGRVWRRIKHFSGYNVVFGIDCEDPMGCGEGESGYDLEATVDGASDDQQAAERATGRSGYITTTGRALGSTN